MSFVDIATNQIIHRVDIKMDKEVIQAYFKILANDELVQQSEKDYYLNQSKYIMNNDPNNSARVNILGKHFDNWIDIMSIFTLNDQEKNLEKLVHELSGYCIEIFETAMQKSEKDDKDKENANKDNI